MEIILVVLISTVLYPGSYLEYPTSTIVLVGGRTSGGSDSLFQIPIPNIHSPDSASDATVSVLGGWSWGLIDIVPFHPHS